MDSGLILASGLGYFFFSGLRTFAVEFLRVHFGLGQAAATGLLAVLGVAALAGALAGRRVADRLIARGHLSGRLIVAGTAFALAAGALLPGLLLPGLLVAAPLLAVGVAGLAGANPPLDAARIDIMHSRLWGRAESARTMLRSLFEAAAPLTFGYVAVHFAGAGDALDEAGGGGTGAQGLTHTIAVMLVPLLLAAAILLWSGRRRYPRDVATALASEPADDTTPTGSRGRENPREHDTP